MKVGLSRTYITVLLLCLTFLQYLSLSPENCEIQNVGGFLKNICFSNDPEFGGLPHNTIYKCVNTNQFYTVGLEFFGKTVNPTVDLLCDQDPNFYQACATGTKSMAGAFGLQDLMAIKRHQSYSAKFPCGYFCQKPTGSILYVPDTGLQTSVDELSFSKVYEGVCNGEEDCMNTDLDESLCKSENYSVVDCDMVCDTLTDRIFTCEDESFCNGYQYGMRCDDGKRYIKPSLVCDTWEDCKDRTDEKNCDITNTTGAACRRDYLEVVPLFNYTRCGSLIENWPKSHGVLNNFCINFMDQTNCTDTLRVGVHCFVGGHMSTVARQIICVNSSQFRFDPDSIPALCDDSLDKECVEVSLTCFLHKHQLCDGVPDCQGHTDETQVICQRMTFGECTRRFKSDTTVKYIPTAWVKDGIEDCLEGEDETDMWPTCGHGRTSRPKVRSNDSCSEVFLCYGAEEFVDFPRLCDRINSCGNENLLCQKSRFQSDTYDTALRVGDDVARFSYCLEGLKNVGELSGAACVREKYTFSSEEWVLGRNFTQKVEVPNFKTDCRYYHGELYVFLSCTDKCISSNSKCPLPKGNPKFDACSGQLKTKLFTVNGHGDLTFLVKNPKTNLLGNNFFVCKNSQTCLTYDKVCNLVDDCGDGSDEESCDNHFRCESSKEYLHVSQQCDGVFHCADKSDECNEACGGNQIIQEVWLKVISWVMGVSALLLNSIGLVSNFSSLYNCKTKAAFVTNCLLILINLGDFVGGVYLTILASFDSYHGAGHCKVQLEWITSTVCVLLGISSTFGSQISLLSMAILSIIRAAGVQGDLRIPPKKTRKSAIKTTCLVLLICLISALASSFPLFSSFEDYFVNGIKYENANTLFVGCPDKRRHLAVIEQYYGRMRQDGGLLTWSRIKPLVANMFSTDYGGIKQKTLSFYGNDPVCVFKYFVRIDDPQRNFTVTLLSVNALCFVAMTVSYTLVAVASRKSVEGLTDKNFSTVNTEVKNNDARLRKVIQAIIISDFLCWMPFTFVCLLHLSDAIDATPWYPIFSILVLPINSVINPILYNKVITCALDRVMVKWESNLFQWLSTLNHSTSSGATIQEHNKKGNNPNEDNVQEQNKNSNNSSEATVLEQNKNSNNSGEATVLEQNKNSNNSSEATVLEQNKNSNNSSEATVLEQNKNINNSSEATVLEQNNNSNNSGEATALEQNKNSNNSSEAAVLEQNKNSNNSSEATALEQNKNSNNSSEAAVLEQNKNSNNSSEATVLEQNKNSNNSSEAAVLEQNKNSNNSSEATVLEQNKNSNNSSEATVLEQNKNSNNSSEATVLEQNKNSNNFSEATVLEQNKNSNNSGEATVLEQNKNSNNSSEATVLEQNKNSNNSSEATVLEQNKNSNNSSEANVLEQNKNSNNSGEATVLEQNKNSNNSGEAAVLEQNKNSNNSSEASSYCTGAEQEQ